MLVKMANADSRIGVFELLLNTIAVKNHLKKWDISQVEALIESSSSLGMISMSQYAKKLTDKWLVHTKEVETVMKVQAPQP